MRDADLSKAGDLGLCLIGPSRYKNVHPDSTGTIFYSCDMVRLAIRWRADMVDKVTAAADTWQQCDSMYTLESRKTGGYRWLNVYEVGDDSFCFGWCHINGNRKHDETRGFVEGNPNKVFDAMVKFLRHLLDLGCRAQLARWDLAIDFPVARGSVRLLKDQRKYSCELSDSFTEYLGRRNAPGRVKVYDKAAELGVPGDLTRVELTCGGDWRQDDILQHLPKVFFTGAEVGGFTGVSAAFVNSIGLLLEHGEPFEPLIQGLDHRMRARIRRAFAQERTLTYEEGVIWVVLHETRSYEHGFLDD